MPFVFTIILIGQGLRQPGYSHVSMLLARLCTTQWVDPERELPGLRVLFIAFSIGLHLGSPNRGGDTGPALLVLSGVGTVVIGMFPGEMSADRSSNRRVIGVSSWHSWGRESVSRDREAAAGDPIGKARRDTRSQPAWPLWPSFSIWGSRGVSRRATPPVGGRRATLTCPACGSSALLFSD